MSLYSRIVVTFISVVIISLFISYLINSLFFHRELFIEEEVTKHTTGVAELVEIAQVEKIPELFETLSEFNFELMLINEEGVLHSFADPSFIIDRETVITVLQSSKKEPHFLPQNEMSSTTRIIGKPVEIANERHALFVRINFEEELFAIKRVIFFTLFLVLFIGSLLILLASRYFVNPIKKLTDAAKEMATGNFSVRLKSKNKDEVGELITSFNYMASELGKIDKMREDFVSNVSHEIQSPLTSIRGFTKALKDDVIPKDHQEEYLDIIYQETERLSRLSDNLLRLASLESEHHPYHPGKYKLDEQIRRTVLATEPLWKNKNLDIHLELESHHVFADQDLFEQVWLNLITNAIRYTDENGMIEISLKEQANELIVSIKDTGKGIPKEAVPHLFERFYKVDKARSSSVKGNGLGLSIVKKILALHGCSIRVESEEGIGSTFIVRIPLLENE
ncbi:sensor histidine kinase [Alkalihalobacterium chitinilyticum]|uniref:Heme sensor protein HssS n=1 Tax=Alkalihalobacterium chitinilyticum TaxID=2980103 RepID=A0ABT5VH90_9BACI|nr:HAMP domain-containing sensor histidine kinase [Alkalihalobacterium chitinilyticum]MDE5414556.1 HAMP domain-containing histidine kinase [Alkalihalobacterium chitinilyticum]